MMSEFNFIPPSAPNDLSFNGNDFVESDFDVDKFLHDHRSNASLETMRDDLGVYLKILRSAMIELINKDYADFVNLSSNLIGLDKAIEHLEGPLGQLREEVMHIRQALDDATVEMFNGLAEHRKIRGKKQSLYSLGRVYKSIRKLSLILLVVTCPPTPDILERAATESNQLKFHASRCNDLIAPDYRKKCEELDAHLIDNVAKLLITSVNTRETDPLIRSLQIYVTLDKVKEAEQLVRMKFIAPALEDIIVEMNLQNEPLGLRSIYQKLLNFVNSEMKQLLDVTCHNRNTVRGFNFLVNSFWPEVEERIELNLKLIYAPGDPELFHSRYVETLDFLTKLEEKCDSLETLSLFKSHPLYSQFIKKWNLPVYFQIRFQEIAGAVEEVLSQPISSASIKNNLCDLDPQDYSLHATWITWHCLMKIWTDGIFLPQLLQQFWKLSLQIIARYNVWCEHALKQSRPSISAPRTSNIIEIEPTSKLEFFVCIHNDAEKFCKQLPLLLNSAKTRLSSSKPLGIMLLEESLEQSCQHLSLVLPMVTDKIVAELLAQSALKLKQVSDIPRLFRRTMREKPTQPCGYVKNALSHLITFQMEYRTAAPVAMDHWLRLTLSALTVEYLSSVKDVLQSVQKTEESLRRLKKIRDKSTGVSISEGQGISDDEKIRVQLEIDVHSYVDTVRSFNPTLTEISHLQELLLVVEKAVNNKGSNKEVDI